MSYYDTPDETDELPEEVKAAINAEVNRVFRGDSWLTVAEINRRVDEDTDEPKLHRVFDKDGNSLVGNGLDHDVLNAALMGPEGLPTFGEFSCTPEELLQKVVARKVFHENKNLNKLLKSLLEKQCKHWNVAVPSDLVLGSGQSLQAAAEREKDRAANPLEQAGEPFEKRARTASEEAREQASTAQIQQAFASLLDQADGLGFDETTVADIYTETKRSRRKKDLDQLNALHEQQKRDHEEELSKTRRTINEQCNIIAAAEQIVQAQTEGSDRFDMLLNAFGAEVHAKVKDFVPFRTKNEALGDWLIEVVERLTELVRLREQLEESDDRVVAARGRLQAAETAKKTAETLQSTAKREYDEALTSYEAKRAKLEE